MNWDSLKLSGSAPSGVFWGWGGDPMNWDSLKLSGSTPSGSGPITFPRGVVYTNLLTEKVMRNVLMKVLSFFVQQISGRFLV